MLLVLTPSTPQNLPRRDIISLLLYISGLLIWFSVGVMALATSLTSFAEKAIIALQ